MGGFEKPGYFYLGRKVDPASGQLLDEPLLYDARDLTTHAVCVGMTGSGKTGLCIDLIEEATLQGIPSILIDPKGDITNLLLTFPDLTPEQFRPWVNPDDARRRDMDLDAFAAHQAELWRKGLADWGQGPERVRRLRDSAAFTIYTPGSEAGVPVSILRTLAAPPLDWETHAEELREKISTTVSALLGLIGIQAVPMRSREHILLSHLFEHAWRQGQDLDMVTLIRQIQDPPVRQIGIFDVDTFFPSKERFELAMSFNGLIAAPTFQSWLTGVPLDMASMLHTPDGRPQVNIFYIAHLPDPERMFFVTLLLEETLAWMRTQPGTTGLRAILYFDEVRGYFPPVANPPSKEPILTLMKQARAYGLGVVLVTQNPVDLDYKGLTNAGTWFIGKLQTEQDKNRLLDGIEGALGAGALGERSTLDRLIAGLKSRVFLLHNVHEGVPTLFHTRWAMSYLRGPLTRDQVRALMHDRAVAQTVAPPPQTAPSATPTPAAESALAPRPSLPNDLPQVFLPIRVGRGAAGDALRANMGQDVEIVEQQLVYRPAVLAIAAVQFNDRQTGSTAQRELALLLDPPGELGVARWEDAQEVDIDLADVRSEPESEASYESVPPSINTARELRTLKNALEDWLYRTQSVEVLYHPTLKLQAALDEDERTFLRRCEDAARERRDAELEDVRRAYEKRLERIQEKLAREQRELEEDRAEFTSRRYETLSYIGETVLGFVLGRRRSTRAISSALRKQRLTGKAKEDIAESEAEIARLKKEIEELEKAREAELAEISDRWARIAHQVEKRQIKPRRVDVQVPLCALAWEPFWRLRFTRQNIPGEWERSAFRPADGDEHGRK